MTLPSASTTAAAPARLPGGARRPLLWGESLVQASRFLAVGVSNTLLSFLVFQTLFAWMPAWSFRAAVAQAVAYACGAVWSFCVNRSWTFRSSGGISGEAVRFIIVQLSLLVMTTLAVSGLVDVLRLHPQASWLAVIAVATLLNFLVTKGFVFRR